MHLYRRSCWSQNMNFDMDSPSGQHLYFGSLVALMGAVGVSAFVEMSIPNKCSTTSHGCSLYSGPTGAYQFTLLGVGITALIAAVVAAFGKYASSIMASPSKPLLGGMMGLLLVLAVVSAVVAMILQGQCQDAPASKQATNIQITSGVINGVSALVACAFLYVIFIRKQ